MMAFGRKCPACGGKNLIDRTSTSWLATLPTVRPSACADCRQHLVLLAAFAIGSKEQRHSLRARMPPFFLIRIPATNQYARIQNISEGGLCFDLDHKARPLTSHLLELDIFNCSNNTTLERIPAELVSTTEQVVENKCFKTRILNNRTRFVNLNQAQRKVLATCMQQYGF
ncbi:MAG: PilZ domain-containing protein [Proteobacteria bacterium]|nr:PilZ domain-containing protein [Pseudomonadota bacterium]